MATQLRRLRSLLLFGALVGIVVLAGVTEAAKAGGRGGLVPRPGRLKGASS